MANGLGAGRAATSIGQMLMQKALFDQQRQDRELERKDIADLRREQAITSRLGTALAPGDTFLPYSPGMQAPPEGAQPLNVMGESGFRMPAPSKPPSVTLKRPGFDISGTPEQVTQALPTIPALPPEPVTFETGGRKFPDTPEGQQQALSWERQISAAGRAPEGLAGSGAGGGTMQERLNQRLAQNALAANRVLNELDSEMTKVLPSLAARGGAITGSVANILTGERGQAAGTAALNFVNPAVRYLSGAQMNQQESQRYYRALIPQVGDKPETVQLKQLMRAELESAMQSGQWQGQVGANGEPDFANIDAFIAQFQEKFPTGQEGGSVQLPDIGLSGGGRSLTPMQDAFGSTASTPTLGGGKQPISQDQADYLRTARGMSDEQISDRYIVR